MLVKAHATDFVQEFGFLLDGNRVRFMDGTVVRASRQLCLSPVRRVIARWMEREARVCCTVADTPSQRITGLQGHAGLAVDEGMYFPYQDYMNVTFHQGSVPFGLDIVFLRDSHVVRVQADTQVGSSDKWCCADCDGVIEVNARYCAQHGIQEDDRILLSAVSDTDLAEMEQQRVADATLGAYEEAI